MTLTRARAKGRRGGEGERFARLPISVLQSEAVCSLKGDWLAAYKVMVALAAGYSGRNNGALAMTPRYAKRFGITSTDTLYRALKELKRRKIIIETRQGWRGVKDHFALYALAWCDIDNREGQPLLQPEPKHLQALLDWREDQADNRTSTAQISTDYRTNSIPAAGIEASISIPTTEIHRPISIPAAGKTLRFSAGRRAARDQLRPPSNFNSSSRAPAILQIVRAHSGLDAFELAKLCKCTEPEVHRALQTLQAETAT
ncbi:MAG: hypothetical protein QM718_04880 [Steroidobacteraceae bacterium]